MTVAMKTITLDNKVYSYEQLSPETQEYVISINLTKHKLSSLQARLRFHQEVRSLYLQKLKSVAEIREQ